MITTRHAYTARRSNRFMASAVASFSGRYPKASLVKPADVFEASAERSPSWCESSGSWAQLRLRCERWGRHGCTRRRPSVHRTNEYRCAADEHQRHGRVHPVVVRRGHDGEQREDRVQDDQYARDGASDARRRSTRRSPTTRNGATASPRTGWPPSRSDSRCRSADRSRGACRRTRATGACGEARAERSTWITSADNVTTINQVRTNRYARRRRRRSQPRKTHRDRKVNPCVVVVDQPHERVVVDDGLLHGLLGEDVELSARGRRSGERCRTLGRPGHGRDGARGGTRDRRQRSSTTSRATPVRLADAAGRATDAASVDDRGRVHAHHGYRPSLCPVFPPPKPVDAPVQPE